MFIALDYKIRSPTIRYVTTMDIPDVGDSQIIYEINEKTIDMDKLLCYIDNSTVVDLKDKKVKVFYKKQEE